MLPSGTVFFVPQRSHFNSTCFVAVISNTFQNGVPSRTPNLSFNADAYRPHVYLPAPSRRWLTKSLGRTLFLFDTLKVEQNWFTFECHQSITDSPPKGTNITQQNIVASLNNSSPLINTHAVLVYVARWARRVHVLNNISLGPIRCARNFQPVVANHGFNVVGVPAVAKRAAAICATPAKFNSYMLSLGLV